MKPPRSIRAFSSWLPPKMGWIKINGDGAVSINGQSASIRRALRDSNANWLNVEVECDNALLVELILFGGGANSSLVELRLLHQLLRQRWEVCVRHIPRDQNGVADHMAKCANIGDSLFCLSVILSVSVTGLLGEDRYGSRSI
ncbi:hypothetical protein Gotri_016631 [Gossypium trilobum]|uniref:RNase H type-1 domain-containing protein n=1 Tax=Gossypium trilobum TaxID=34281 RepID=A0A7J9E5E5_9ROSI|nr:hypothetical protein [Gossypium trilobum]